MTSDLIKLKNRRKRWLSVHLYLGLSLGFFAAIFGLTGSILVFHVEINELLNPQLLTVSVPSDNAVYKPLADIFAAGRTALPTQAKQTFASYPRNAEAAVKVNYQLPVVQDVNETWEVGINPYTAQVTGKRLMAVSNSTFPKTFIDFIFELHYAFFLGDKIGYLITSIMSALLIISVLTGLIVWYPLTGKWRQALTFKAKASRERFVFDLHKTSGFYSTLVLIPVLFSGIYMNLPQYVIPVIDVFSPVTYRYWFKSTPTSTQAITMEDAVAIAKNRYAKGRPDWIYGATTANSAYMVCLNDVQETGSFLQRRCVTIDQYSGKLLDLDDPTLSSAGDVFTQWQWPLHSGQAFGWTGRILVFLSGLACPVLFVTGVTRWLQKRNAKKNKPVVKHA